MLDKIKCKTLIMCGDNDNQNMRSAKLFNKAIKNSCLKQLFLFIFLYIDILSSSNQYSDN